MVPKPLEDRLARRPLCQHASLSSALARRFAYVDRLLPLLALVLLSNNFVWLEFAGVVKNVNSGTFERLQRRQRVYRLFKNNPHHALSESSQIQWIVWHRGTGEGLLLRFVLSERCRRRCVSWPPRG